MSDIFKSIQRALQNHRYKVSYEAPNCIRQKEHPNGDVYYVLMGKDATYGSTFGSCTVQIWIREGSFCLMNDFVNGWELTESELEDEDSDYIQDHLWRFTDSIEELQEVHIFPSVDDDKTLIRIYELATGEVVDEYYSYKGAPEERFKERGDIDRNNDVGNGVDDDKEQKDVIGWEDDEADENEDDDD